MPGLILVYTGHGKGKTTAALGLSLRAMGHNLKVGFMQFMKGSPDYGEFIIAPNLPGFCLKQVGRDTFVNPENPDPVDIRMAQEGLTTAETWLSEGRFDLVVLDEILVAIAYGLLTEEQVLAVLENDRIHSDIVLTGRYAPERIIQVADTVTVMQERRHAYQRGIAAKAGMEF